MLVVSIINMLKKYQWLKKRFKKWTTLDIIAWLCLWNLTFLTVKFTIKKSQLFIPNMKKNHKLNYNLVYISY